MHLEELYEDSNFNQSLVRLAVMHLLPFDEYRQEVFLYLLEHDINPLKAAHRIADRMKYRNDNSRSASIDPIENDDEYESVSDIMSRMIYSGAAVKVG